MYRITTETLGLDLSGNDDAILPEDDPIHELRAAAMLGGLGAKERLANYNAMKTWNKNLKKSPNDEDS